MLLTLCFCGSFLYAQDVFNRPQAPTGFTEDLRTMDFVQRNVMSRLRLTKPGGANENVIGSAYLNENFKRGGIFYNKTLIGEYLLRYNVYNEEFEVLNTDKTKSAVNKTSEIYVTIENDVYIFKYYMEDDGKSKFGYFKVLSENKDDKCILLKKDKKLLSESRKAITSFDVTRPARFADSEAYYLLFEDKEIIKIRQQNGYISRFFKKRGIDVKSYLQENNLNVKNTDDLKKVVAYCNSLL